MLHKGWGVGLCILWALLGWAQTYGPGEVWYGGVRLQFAGKLATAGTCAPATQPGPGVTQIQCQVPEGAAGTIELTATRTPAGAVNIRAESPPAGWPSSLWVQQMGQWVDSRSSVASGWGAVTAQYRFTPPAGSAGRSYEVRFRAWTAGVIGELELRVILDVVRGITPTPPTPPTYGPFTGTTDGAGRFDVPIPTLPNTAVTGLLTECTVRPLPHTPVSVTLVPKPGTTIRGVGDIGAVRVSSPGYPEAEIVQLTLASSMDMWGRTYTTVDVGTVCLRPTVPPVTPPPGPITGKTDGEGKFTVPLPWPGTTVTGRLTECGQQPLPNQTFTLTLLPKGEVIASPEDIAGFNFSVPGYQKTPVTEFSKFSLFGLTAYSVGDVCLTGPVVEIGEEEAPPELGCDLVLPKWVKDAIDAIQERKKKLEESLKSQDATIQGVRLAKEGKPRYAGAEWDAVSEAIKEKYGEEVWRAFVGCYWVDLDKGEATRKDATVKDLVGSIERHIQRDLEALAGQLKEWDEFVKGLQAHCGNAHSPCECFNVQFFVGRQVPESEVVQNYLKTFGSSPVHALVSGEPFSSPFLREVGQGPVSDQGPIEVPQGGWVAARAVKKDGPHWYTFDGQRYNCCWADHELGAFVQIIIVWPGQDEKEIRSGWPPPAHTAYGWVREGWFSAMTEMAVYHTYSWTPRGYKVPLVSLVATAGAGQLAGVTLNERREEWVLWPVPEGTEGEGKLFLVINGVVCQEISIKVSG